MTKAKLFNFNTIILKVLFLVGFFGLIPDIRLIYNAGYLANVRYPANYQISGIKNQLDIRYPDSFNTRYPVVYWKLPDIRLNTNF